VGRYDGWRWPHRSSALGAMGHDGLGCLALNGVEGKGILTRGSLTAGQAPRRLMAVESLLQDFGSACDTSKASLVLKLNVRW
jgi:hypothetical protein